MLQETESKETQLSFESLIEEKKDWRASVPTVSELTRRIRGHLENAFVDVWVKGEVSNFRKPVSGHAYFCLKDATTQIKAVLFRQALSKVKFQLQDGMEILLHGKVTVYEARGEYQMVCDAVEPVGAGALQLAFEQLKSKLEKEGLFDPKFKKALPMLPKRIGIVTSSTGAAVHDILKVLSRRFPNLHLIIIPAAVQGEKASGEIVRALGLAERWNKERPTQMIDVLIVGRGGGSLEDLWPFNEEIVARALFACTIPCISAVGHEIDFTIADFVSDLRAPTPSAAAEIVIPRKEDLILTIEQYKNRIQSLMGNRLDQLKLHLTHLSRRLIDPRKRIQEMKEKIKVMMERMTSRIQTRCKLLRSHLESRMSLLHSLSPLQVMGRGYSITRNSEGNIVRSAKAVRLGQRLRVDFVDGSVESTVDKV